MKTLEESQNSFLSMIDRTDFATILRYRYKESDIQYLIEVEEENLPIHHVAGALERTRIPWVESNSVEADALKQSVALLEKWQDNRSMVTYPWNDESDPLDSIKIATMDTSALVECLWLPPYYIIKFI